MYLFSGTTTVLTVINIYRTFTNGKGIPITGHEGPWGIWNHIDRRKREGRSVAMHTLCTDIGKRQNGEPSLGRLFSEGHPQYSFYKKLSGPPGLVWVQTKEEKSEHLRPP